MDFILNASFLLKFETGNAKKNLNGCTFLNNKKKTFIFLFLKSTDTYVKTYLKEDRTKMNKKKTKIVCNSWTPQFKHSIKYTASTVYNRSLLVMLWKKEKGFASSSNQPLGLVEIAINQMELDKPTTEWYNLYEMNLKEKNENRLLRQQSDI